jgi:hypothetical protein
VDINDKVPGDEIKANEKVLQMSIEVSANNEIKIDRIQVLINGRQDKRYNFNAQSQPNMFSDKALQFDHSYRS